MATYELAGKKYEFPDGMSDAEALKLMQQDQGQVSQATAPEAPTTATADGSTPTITTAPTLDAPIADSIDPATLASNKDWLASSKILFETNEGRSWGVETGGLDKQTARGMVTMPDPYAGYTDQQLSDYGLNAMGWFNYNMPKMAVDAAKVANAPEDFQKSFLYMMETYDALQMSWGGTGRLIKGAAADPLTYVGLGTFGIGTVAATGGKVATKQGIKELLKLGVKRSLTLGIEGGIYGGLYSVNKQSVEVSAGAKEAISGTQVATDAAIAAAAALTLGTAVSVVAKKGGQAWNWLRPSKVTPPPGAAPPVDPLDFPVTGMDATGRPLPTGATPLVDPNVTVAGAAPTPPAGAGPVIEAALPGNLAGAKPRYNYGSKGFELSFANDTEKALFITSQAKKSKSDEAYRAWLRSTGLSDTEIDTLGQAVRAHIKDLAKGSNEPVLNIGNIAPRKQPVVSPTVEPVVRTSANRPEMVDTPSNVPTTSQDIVAAVKAAAPDMTTGNLPKTRVELFKSAEDTYNAFRNMGVQTAQEVRDLFTKFALSPEQGTVIKLSVQQAAENATVARSEFLKVKNAIGSTADEVAQATEALNKIGPIQTLLADLDKSLSSGSGTDLGSRVGGMLTGERRGLSVESILAETGVDLKTATVEQITTAENALVRQVDDFLEQARTNKEVFALEKKAAEQYAAGDILGAATSLAEKNALLTVVATREATARSLGAKIYDGLNTGVHKLNEYIISMVFTPNTAVVNFLPTFLKTLVLSPVRLVVRGGGRAARAEAGHYYGAMMAHQGAAFRAAAVVFRLEQSILTGRFNSVLEHGPAIKGIKGRVIRIIPRILNATDEYFSQIHYRGFIQANSAYAATERGLEDGLKGAALKAFVKQEVQKATDQAYEISPGLDAIDMLRIKGTQRGLKGDKLAFWIKTELDRNGDLFRRAVSQAGKNYANDVLFKRQFSGDNVASKLASGYEKFVNSHPLMRVAGQLFFRTPVRLFEEGIRMTPGIQFLAPNFLSDLAGKNGTTALIRSKGELLMGYGITAYAMALYGTGSITGQGPTDPKQRKALEDTGWQAYSIRFSNGSWWSFRNLEPFATPMKVMVNLLERSSELEYRKAQGEKTEGLQANLQQYFGVGLGAAVQSVRDASLAQGVDQIGKAWAALTEEEDTTMVEQLSKLAGLKAQLLVPGMYSKAMNFSNPTLTDPKSLDQYLWAKMNSEFGKVPKQYDALGRPRTVLNPYSSFLFPIATSEGMMKDGATEKELAVMDGLSDLAIANDTNFAFPYKMPGFTFDMRTRMTSDGKETLYDRVVRTYHDLNPAEGLYPIFEGDGIGSLGTKNNNGSRLTVTNKVIKAYRDAAFAVVMSQELNLLPEFIQNKMDAVTSSNGAQDGAIMPFRK